jgi:hypothetical protein
MPEEIKTLTSSPPPSRKIPLAVMIIALVIITIIGSYFALSYFIPTDSSPSSLPAAQPSDSTTQTPVLTVTDYRPGNHLTIDSATMNQPGFIVVSEKREEIARGIIGVSSLINQATASDISVELQRPTQTGEILYVWIYRDDGDGLFQSPADTPAIGSNGQPIAVRLIIGRAD